MSDSYITKYPQAYAEWVAAGGIENNFRKHCLALGLQSPNVRDLVFLAEEAQTDVRQIRDMMLPFLPMSAPLA